MIPTRMHPRATFLVAAVLGVAVLADAPRAEEADATPVAPVARVDIERYSGLWHEIAKIPNRFQKPCARGTTAEYALREDGRLTVRNRCFESDGSLREANGVAKIVDAGSNAKLKVSFVSFLGWRPFWGDYWVIGLDPEYQWAVVGTPDRKYGWVLARDAAPEAAVLERAYAIIERNGYDRDAFETSPP